MFERLKKAVNFVLDPPWQPDGPHPLTLAVPEARSTFNRGDVGWASRPRALVRCPSCDIEFFHEHAIEMIRCPRCRFECKPEQFGELELVELECPLCASPLNHGIRHPNIFDFPQWAACPECQYHWEFQHSFNRRKKSPG